MVADGILDAVRDHNMTQTIVVRVKGTGSDLAKEKVSSKTNEQTRRQPFADERLILAAVERIRPEELHPR